MSRKPIELDDSVMDVLVKMAEGNPGAVTVMTQILEHEKDKGPLRLLSLDDMNIRGSQIWVGFKDHCESKIEVFVKAIKDRDPAMVETINRECFHPHMTNQGHEGYDELARIDRHA